MGIIVNTCNIYWKAEELFKEDNPLKN